MFRQAKVRQQGVTVHLADPAAAQSQCMRQQQDVLSGQTGVLDGVQRAPAVALAAMRDVSAEQNHRRHVAEGGVVGADAG